jgi:hypothetical protein
MGVGENVKPIYQTEFGEGKGNCFQAALASLLEVELDDIPNFAKYNPTGQFWPKFWEWMQENKLGILTTQVKPNGYSLMRVKSPRLSSHHEMVAFNGDPVHDPYPGGNCEHNGLVHYDVIYPLDLGKWSLK